MSKTKFDWPGIIAEIKRRGFSLSELARENGYHPSTFVQVKNKCHYKAQSIIAACIDQDPRIIWPDRYLIKKPHVISNRYRALLESKKSAANVDMEKAA